LREVARSAGGSIKFRKEVINMTSNLRLVFGGNDSQRISFNFPFADTGASAAQVRNLMQMMVANGDIYANVPQSLTSAEFVINERRPVDIG